MFLQDRIAAYALRYWIAKDMTEWPTVRRVCKALRITHKDIEEHEGDGTFETTSFFVEPPDPRGEHFVEATTPEVEEQWCRYYLPINKRCYCGKHLNYRG